MLHIYATINESITHFLNKKRFNKWKLCTVILIWKWRHVWDMIDEIGSIDRSFPMARAIYRRCNSYPLSTVAHIAYCNDEDDGVGRNSILRSIWDTESPSGRPSLPVNKAIRWPKLAPSPEKEWLSGRYFTPWENIEETPACRTYYIERGAKRDNLVLGITYIRAVL